MKNVSKFSRFSRLHPKPAAKGARASQLVTDTFQAYNAARLREGCELFTQKMLPRNGLVGVSLTGALVPAGLGISCLIPLIKAGFIDWIEHARPVNDVPDALLRVVRRYQSERRPDE